MTLPLWPPKPKEFERITSTLAERGSPITTSKAISGSTTVVPAVGGMSWFCRVNTEATPSRAPAAAREWPRCPLIDVVTGACVAKDLAHRHGLGEIVEWSGRAVRVDVRDIARRELGVLKG